MALGEPREGECDLSSNADEMVAAVHMNRIGSRTVIAMILLVSVALLAFAVGPQRLHSGTEQSVATITQNPWFDYRRR